MAGSNDREPLSRKEATPCPHDPASYWWGINKIVSPLHPCLVGTYYLCANRILTGDHIKFLSKQLSTFASCCHDTYYVQTPLGEKRVCFTLGVKLYHREKSEQELKAKAWEWELKQRQMEGCCLLSLAHSSAFFYHPGPPAQGWHRPH